MDDIKEIKDTLHMLKCYVYSTCKAEVDAMKNNKITDEETLDVLFDRICCMAEDKLFYNLYYELVNYVETFDRGLGSEYRTKLKIHLDYQLEHSGN